MKSRLLLGMTLRRLASLKTGIAVHDFRQMTEAVSMVVREKMPMQRLINCMKPGNALFQNRSPVRASRCLTLKRVWHENDV